MSSLADRLVRLRWMLVPIAAYLVVTLAFPIANGAARRDGFVQHGAWIVGGCLAAVALALLGGVVVELVRHTWRRHR